MPNTTYNYEMTEYPYVFRHTYWGNFEYSEKDYKDIIQRRNEFIEMYKIKKCVNHLRYTKRFEKEFETLDHCEMFETADKTYILVCSDYDRLPSNKFGWIQYHNLYSNCSNSYIKLVC